MNIVIVTGPQLSSARGTTPRRTALARTRRRVCVGSHGRPPVQGDRSGADPLVTRKLERIDSAAAPSG
jgi:hypothetical protein